MRLVFIIMVFYLHACGSPTSSQLHSEVIDEEDYLFVGCVPSFSECRYSCPSINSFYAEESPDKCWAYPTYAKIACYCRKQTVNTTPH